MPVRSSMYSLRAYSSNSQRPYKQCDVGDRRHGKKSKSKYTRRKWHKIVRLTICPGDELFMLSTHVAELMTKKFTFYSLITLPDCYHSKSNQSIAAFSNLFSKQQTSNYNPYQYSLSADNDTSFCLEQKRRSSAFDWQRKVQCTDCN